MYKMVGGKRFLEWVAVQKWEKISENENLLRHFFGHLSGG
jgi:hypothetical protein